LILLAVKLDFVADFRCVIVSLFVVEVERFRKRFKVVLSVDQVLNRKLTESEQLYKVRITHPL
jgi:hypothetical protein